MTAAEHNTKVLGTRLAQICRNNDAEPAEYEGYVKLWVENLSKDKRPQISAVTMYATRSLYNMPQIV